MTIRTVTASGVTEVNFNSDGTKPYFYSSEKYCWIKNLSDADMYASLDSACTAGAAGTVLISAGECVLIELSPANKVYISGSGNAEIHTRDSAECPFKKTQKGGEKLLRYLGATTTELADGATTNPIIINGKSITAKEADWAIYESDDFIFNGSIWQQVGDLSNYYTKYETDTLLFAKANTDDVVMKTDVVSAPTTAEINAAITHIWGGNGT